MSVHAKSPPVSTGTGRPSVHAQAICPFRSSISSGAVRLSVPQSACMFNRRPSVSPGAVRLPVQAQSPPVSTYTCRLSVQVQSACQFRRMPSDGPGSSSMSVQAQAVSWFSLKPHNSSGAGRLLVRLKPYVSLGAGRLLVQAQAVCQFSPRLSNLRTTCLILGVMAGEFSQWGAEVGHKYGVGVMKGVEHTMGQARGHDMETGGLSGMSWRRLVGMTSPGRGGSTIPIALREQTKQLIN